MKNTGCKSFMVVALLMILGSLGQSREAFATTNKTTYLPGSQCKLFSNYLEVAGAYNSATFVQSFSPSSMVVYAICPLPMEWYSTSNGSVNGIQINYGLGVTGCGLWYSTTNNTNASVKYPQTNNSSYAYWSISNPIFTQANLVCQVPSGGWINGISITSSY